VPGRKLLRFTGPFPGTPHRRNTVHLLVARPPPPPIGVPPLLLPLYRSTCTNVLGLGSYVPHFTPHSLVAFYGWDATFTLLRLAQYNVPVLGWILPYLPDGSAVLLEHPPASVMCYSIHLLPFHLHLPPTHPPAFPHTTHHTSHHTHHHTHTSHTPHFPPHTHTPHLHTSHTCTSP